MAVLAHCCAAAAAADEQQAQCDPVVVHPAPSRTEALHYVQKMVTVHWHDTPLAPLSRLPPVKAPKQKKNWEELTRKFRDCKAVPSVHPAIHISIRISIQKGNPIPLHSIICIDNQLQSASYTYQSWQYQSEWTSPMLRTHYVKFNRKIPQLQQRKRQR